MSSSDPADIRRTLEEAEDAFEERGGGIPEYEEGIKSGGGWETQLTKACRLLEVADVLREQNGYHTAVIELCFGAIERSTEAYAVAMAGDEVEDFRDHKYSYERAHQIGLFGEETAERMRGLYSENRTESYYGGSRPTDRQADTMYDLAVQVHSFSVEQIREGGVCICDG
ncbi:MAG: DNA-binding protein [Halobacteriales archaeon]|nr:DNA-binding protein [Halobacteriales archaeon]